MSHTPERPELYVCTDCQAVYAGTVVPQGDGQHRYEEPDGCSACGGTDFVEMAQYPHHHRTVE